MTTLDPRYCILVSVYCILAFYIFKYRRIAIVLATIAKIMLAKKFTSKIFQNRASSRLEPKTLMDKNCSIRLDKTRSRPRTISEVIIVANMLYKIPSIKNGQRIYQFVAPTKRMISTSPRRL